MKIYDREIGPDRPPYFIAEIGANHDGELDRALRLIELAADAGADAVKFQHFEVATIVSRRGFEELGGKLAHQADWKKSVYEVYEDAALPMEWTEHLSSFTHDHGIASITTPYSIDLVDAVKPYVDAYKIGSGDITYHDLIRYVTAQGKPVLMATGASNADEVDRAIGPVLDATPPGEEANLVLMQCNTDYLGDFDTLSYQNLRAIPRWTDDLAYCRVVGLSDHTPGHLAVCAAVALGASVIEKHFTDDRTRKGPDHRFALEPYEWCAMQDEAKLVYASLGDGVKKVEENEQEARIVQRRALRWARDLRVGHEVEASDLIATRPCPPGALEPREIDRIIGRQLLIPVERDTLVRRDI